MKNEYDRVQKEVSPMRSAFTLILFSCEKTSEKHWTVQDTMTIEPRICHNTGMDNVSPVWTMPPEKLDL